MIVSSITLVFFALVTSVASISYDCDTRGDPESEKYWSGGSYKKDVLPCEFQEIDIPAGYNKSVNPTNANHKLNVFLENVEFMEDVEQCNATVGANFVWTDQRLKFVDNANDTSKKPWFRVPLSAMKYIWDPDPRISLFGCYPVFMTGNGLSRLIVQRRGKNMSDFVSFYATFQKSIIVDSSVGYTYYPYDKHEFVLYQVLGSEGTWTSITGRNPSFDKTSTHLSFKIHVVTQDVTSAAERNEVAFYGVPSVRKFVIVYSRKLQSYIIKTYIPSGLFVVLCWLSMLVPVELATERVALCTATLLTITTFFNTASQLGPPVSYLRAYDIWLLGCILFVFIILFENIAVMKITGRFNKIFSKPAGDGNSGLENAFQNIRQLQHRVGIENTGTLSEKQETVTSKPGSGVVGKETGLVEETEDDSRQKIVAARQVDRIAIYLVTAAILIFNMTYWIWLLATKQTQCERDSECSRDM